MFSSTCLIPLLKPTRGIMQIAALIWKGLYYISSLRGAKLNPLMLPDEEFTFLDSVFPRMSPSIRSRSCRTTLWCRCGGF